MLLVPSPYASGTSCPLTPRPLPCCVSVPVSKAFIKQPLAIAGGFGETKCFPNCFAELNTSLGIIFISNIVVGNLGEIVPAIVKAKLKTAAESKGSTLADAGGVRVSSCQWCLSLVPFPALHVCSIRREVD